LLHQLPDSSVFPSAWFEDQIAVLAAA